VFALEAVFHDNRLRGASSVERKGAKTLEMAERPIIRVIINYCVEDRGKR